MSQPRDDSSQLEDALAFVPPPHRHNATDSLACYLHNDGYALEGNTEANDVEWFARTLFDRKNDNPGAWNVMPEAAKEPYQEIARAVLAVLPAFQLRIAHRLITLSKVVRDIERAARLEKKL